MKRSESNSEKESNNEENPNSIPNSSSNNSDDEKQLAYLKELSGISQILKQAEQHKQNNEERKIEECQLNYIEGLAKAYNEKIENGFIPDSTNTDEELPSVIRYRPNVTSSQNNKKRYKLKSKNSKKEDITNIPHNSKKNTEADKLYDISYIKTLIENKIVSNPDKLNDVKIGPTLSQNLLNNYFFPLKIILESKLSENSMVAIQSDLDEVNRQITILNEYVNNQKDIEDFTNNETEVEISVLEKMLKEKLIEIDALVEKYNK